MTSVTQFKDSFSEEIWESTYKYHEDNNVDDTFKRVAKAIASVEKTEKLKLEWEEKFFDMLTNFKITTGGRIYANAGTEFNGTSLINCFVGPRDTHDIDSIDGILKHLLWQTKTLKSEGGWGENFSYIRPRGSFIHGIGVESPGAVKYMEMFDKSSDIITAGSGRKSTNKKAKKKIRKGAMMGGISDWHPDVIEFITAKQQPGRLQKFNVSVGISDEFMQKLDMIFKLREENIQHEKNNDIEAIEKNNILIEQNKKWDLYFPDTTFEKYKEEWDGNIKLWKSKGYPIVIYNTVDVEWLWNLITESTYNRAEPGLLFLDRANEYNPLYYKENIEISNPCVRKGTLVNTPTGYRKVEDIQVGNFVSTVFGQEPVETIEINENCPIFKVTFSDGGEEYVTAAHQYHAIKNKLVAEKRVSILRLDQLDVGDRVRIEPTKFLDENFNINVFNIGLKTGILLGDGNYTQKTNGIRIASNIMDEDYNNKIKQLFGEELFNKDDISKNSKSMYHMISNKYDSLLNELGLERLYSFEKEIPIERVDSLSYAIGILDGLLATDGNINWASNNPQIRWFTSSKKLAQGIRQLLLYLGCHGRIHIVSKPSDTGGGVINGRQIKRNHPKYQISISGDSIKNYFNNTKLYLIHEEKYNKLKNGVKTTRLTGNNWTASIKSIEQFGYDTVYDLYCRESDTWITCGYVQRGCGEQLLSPGNICCLSSLNLTQFINDDLSDFDYDKIKKYTRYLVRFLDNVNSYSVAPLDNYKFNMENKRRIGCGILGWGSSLFIMKVKFASPKAQEIQEKLMSTFARECYMASIDLAEEKGMFSLCEPEKHVIGKFVNELGLSEDYLNKMRIFGIRNSSLLSIQPNGNSSIFANLVSGGCEPIFMPEYIRTTIVNAMPEHIKNITPKWYEGEWFETEMFKSYKEGDDDMLRGVDEFGVVYKIDKNRGLTKEVLCEDYGVKFLKERGEWNPSADWAVTTTNLTVDEHVRDLKGFARWIDSSISKTINVPFEYSFEDFKKVYFDAWKTGYIKGITTYRSGTMMSVLSAKAESGNGYEEIIQESVKMPDSQQAILKTIRSEGRKWYLTITMDEFNVQPIALFVHTNHPEKNATTHDAVEKLIQLAVDKKIPQHWIDETIKKMETDNNTTKIAKAIGLNLRHGVHIKNVVLKLNEVDTTVNTFLFQIRKFLSQFIKDGEKVENSVCESCGSNNIVFSEGCQKCMSCGSSKCG